MWISTRDFPRGSVVKNPAASAAVTEDVGSIPAWEDPLEKGKATLSSILAWKIPWTEEPGGLQRGGHDCMMEHS